MIYVGWFSTFCLTVCAIPALYSALRTGKVGENTSMLVLWFLGELSRLVYSYNDLPILVNCLINIALLAPLLIMKVKEENR